MDLIYYARIEDIAPRPVLFIVGTKAATLFMSKSGYEKAAQPKEWFTHGWPTRCGSRRSFGGPAQQLPRQREYVLASLAQRGNGHFDRRW